MANYSHREQVVEDVNYQGFYHPLSAPKQHIIHPINFLEDGSQAMHLRDPFNVVPNTKKMKDTYR